MTAPQYAERIESFEQELLNAEIARKIYDLRMKADLSQRELAKRVGTTASVICRLENADYEGHSPPASVTWYGCGWRCLDTSQFR